MMSHEEYNYERFSDMASDIEWDVEAEIAAEKAADREAEADLFDVYSDEEWAAEVREAQADLDSQGAPEISAKEDRAALARRLVAEISSLISATRHGSPGRPRKRSHG